MEFYDPDPLLELRWAPDGRYWRCCTVSACGVESGFSPPIEPINPSPGTLRLRPGEGVFIPPGYPLQGLVVGDVVLAEFCDVAKPRPTEEQLVEHTIDTLAGVPHLVLGVRLVTPHVAPYFHLASLFTPILCRKDA